MIFINEWLPNPTGSDAKGEFVELFNNGTAPVNLSGWILKATAKKKFFLTQTIGPDKYLLLPRSETKLSLKNSGEDISLFDSKGNLVDHSSFLGSAPEGKSFSRIDYNTSPSEHFAFSGPTPGAANDISVNVGISVNKYPTDTPLNYLSMSGVDFLGMALGVGAIFASLVIYFLHHEKEISDLFFGRDEAAW